MTLFDQLVDQSIKAHPDLVTLKPVVEKEILHADILREMNSAGFLSELTFIGGTCLRTCYGSDRLSEDLDFNGGYEFNKADLINLGSTIASAIRKRYDLQVLVEDPVKESGNVATWKITIHTKPERKDLPAQRVHIDICAMPSHLRVPAAPVNRYNIEAGVSSLILWAEDQTEILADKLIALAMRQNRVQLRDVWDILWLCQKNIKLSQDLLVEKLADRQISPQLFLSAYATRVDGLRNMQKNFLFEMRRFLPPSALNDAMNQELWWSWAIKRLLELPQFDTAWGLTPQ